MSLRFPASMVVVEMGNIFVHETSYRPTVSFYSLPVGRKVAVAVNLADID